jgi:hypothetical protein
MVLDQNIASTNHLLSTPAQLEGSELSTYGSGDRSGLPLWGNYRRIGSPLGRLKVPYPAPLPLLRSSLPLQYRIIYNPYLRRHTTLRRIAAPLSIRKGSLGSDTALCDMSNDDFTITRRTTSRSRPPMYGENQSFGYYELMWELRRESAAATAGTAVRLPAAQPRSVHC